MDYTLRGTIVNCATGETSEVEHYLYPAGSKIEVVGYIMHAEISELGDASEPFQVDVGTLVLDSIGGVFDAGLLYLFKSREEAERLVSDLEPDSIFVLAGPFSLAEDGSVIIFHPKYVPVPHREHEHIRRAILLNYNQPH